METIERQKYVEYLQALLVASYTVKPTLTCSIEDKLEAIAVDKWGDKIQAKIDVQRILNLRKALTIFLEKIVEERHQSLMTRK